MFIVQGSLQHLQQRLPLLLRMPRPAVTPRAPA
jgi:hypothetical protein